MSQFPQFVITEFCHFIFEWATCFIVFRLWHCLEIRIVFVFYYLQFLTKKIAFFTFVSGSMLTGRGRFFIVWLKKSWKLWNVSSSSRIFHNFKFPIVFFAKKISSLFLNKLVIIRPNRTIIWLSFVK